MRIRFLAALMVVAGSGTALAQMAPSLQLQGQPYSGGSMTLHLFGSAGQPALVAYGLDPLTTPLVTGKGPWFIGTLMGMLPLGVIPAAGRIDVAFTMPPIAPAFEGIPLVLEGYVPFTLSNAVTLPLDQPYLLPSTALVIDNPIPTQQADFGDTLAAGDFDGDGVVDLAVGAWFEDVAGADKAGRVYIMWGPDFATYFRMTPTAPVLNLHFGQGLLVADFDGDGIDDLGVGQGTGGDPPFATHASIRVFKGGASFPSVEIATATSVGAGQEAYVFSQIKGIGDLNDDAWPDIVVGAPDATVSGFTRAGRLEVFYGPDFANTVLIENPQPKTNDFFGSSLALCDLNADKVPDVVEASGRASVAGISQAGRAHVYDGSTLALLATIDNPAPGLNDRFGEGLHARDLDADGEPEIIASDVKKHVYLVRDPLAAPTFQTLTKPPTPNPTGAAVSFGYFLASTDANGDGLLDVLISDPFEGDVAGCGVVGGAVPSMWPWRPSMRPFIASATR
jgi:hypothetical protein